MARPGNGSRLNSTELDAKQLLTALAAFKRGDFSARLPDEWTGVAGKIADTFNDVVATNQRMTRELERIGRVVGKEGRITQRASLGDVSDSWAEAIGSVNDLIGDLVHPTSEMARVIGAVAKGDLSKTMATEIESRPLEGAFLRTAKTVNTMVGQLGERLQSWIRRCTRWQKCLPRVCRFLGKRERAISSGFSFAFERSARVDPRPGFRLFRLRLGSAPPIVRTRRMDQTCSLQPDLARLRRLPRGATKRGCLIGRVNFGSLNSSVDSTLGLEHLAANFRRVVSVQAARFEALRSRVSVNRKDRCR